MANTYYIKDQASLSPLEPFLRSGDILINAKIPRKDIHQACEISPSELGESLDGFNFRIVNIRQFKEIRYLYLHLDKVSKRDRVYILNGTEKILMTIYALDIPFTIHPKVVYSSYPAYSLLRRFCEERSSSKEIQPFGDMTRCMIKDSPYIPSVFTIKGETVYYIDRPIGALYEGDLTLKNRLLLSIKCKNCEFLKYCPCRISPEGCMLRNHSFPFLRDFLGRLKK